MLADVALGLSIGLAHSLPLTCNECNQCASKRVSSLALSISHTCTHSCTYTCTLSTDTLGLQSLRQGLDSSSRTQTLWGQRAWLIERLVLRPSVPAQLLLGLGVVGSGSGLPVGTGDEGPHSAWLPRLHPCGELSLERGWRDTGQSILAASLCGMAYSVWSCWARQPEL